jgi:peptidyl-prolyl cis-trans isomerase C
MPPIFRIGAAASAIVLLLAVGALAVRAQQATEPPEEQVAAPAPAPDPDAVVARVGDVTVTEQDVKFAGEAFEGELANVPDAQRRSVTIDAFVNMLLLAKAAEDAGLDKTEDFAAKLEFLTLQALRNLYVTEAIMGGITDADMQEGYQTLVVGQHAPQEQVRARHILVETKEAADKVIADLKGGAAFEELAKQSKDPSGQNGGDLGFFGKGQMVPPFEEAAFALEPGEITEEPVESQFGWHVIRVEEKRMSEPPSLSEVEPELRNYLLRQKFETVIAELRDKYTVEIVGAPEAAESPAAAPETDEQPAEAPQSGEGSQN